MALLDERLHRFGVDDYLRLAEDPEGGRLEGTELVEGVVYDVSPESSLHARAVLTLLDALRDALPGREVYNVGSVEIGERSLWEPDIYVLRPDIPERTYPKASDIELVVEVAVMSLSADLGARYRGYAAAGIPEYWVIVPEAGGYVLCHRRPAGDRYEAVERFELAAGYRSLDVADLL